ncbi:hypothetical protein [Enterovibrio norvegicus]|uniref:hypothetical protein n=1 Tax=Enterovibrio norvegicus TaxID=188144 RepID=UPI003D099323
MKCRYYGSDRCLIPWRITIHCKSTCCIVDWTGRKIIDDKCGHIANTIPPILSRLGFEPADWMNACTKVEQGKLVGSHHAIKAALPLLNRKRVTGFRLPDG